MHWTHGCSENFGLNDCKNVFNFWTTSEGRERSRKQKEEQDKERETSRRGEKKGKGACKGEGDRAGESEEEWTREDKEEGQEGEKESAGLGRFRARRVRSTGRGTGSRGIASNRITVAL